MIDLNKYYISTTYQGASGGSEGRSGFVPKALSAEELKFLRGDGTWQEIQADSQTSTIVQQGSSNWYSASGAAVSYTHTNFLPLSGGTLTGQLNVTSNISATGTVTASAATITGNLATNSNYVVTLQLTANQTANNAADTLISFDPKNDPNNWFSRTAGVGLTARRITPTIPGYYYVSYQLHWNQGTAGTSAQNNIQILKSAAGAGASTIAIAQQPINNSDVSTRQATDAVTYMNGSTDYLIFRAYSSNAAQVIQAPSDGNWTKVEMFKIN